MVSPLIQRRVQIPADLDLRDAFVRQRIEATVQRLLGPTWQVLWTLPGQQNPGHVTAVDSRPMENVQELGPDVKPTHGHQIAARLEAQFGTLVEFLPHERTAIFAYLDPRIVALRSALSQIAKIGDPWDLEIAVGWGEHKGLSFIQDVLVLRSPAVEADKRKDIWLNRVRDVVPTLPGYIWKFEQGETPTEVRLVQVEDQLNAIQPYPWDAPVDYRHIPFAVDENGDPITLGLLEVNQLLGGTPGGGKSGGATTLLCGIARLDHVALIGLDPKKVELNLWASRFSRIAKTESDATLVLEALVNEMESRYDWLEERGLKKLTPAEMSIERPLLALVVDELADLVSVGVTTEDKAAEAIRSTRIRRLIAKGRAAGVVVITATQKPQSDVIPTSLRDLIQLRVAYATTNPAMTDTILGAGMSQNGGLSHTIPASQRGVCYIVNESSRDPIRARTYWVEDNEVEGISKRYAHKRVELPWMPAVDASAATPAFQPIKREKAAPREVELDDLDFSLDDLEDSTDAPETEEVDWDAEEIEPIIEVPATGNTSVPDSDDLEWEEV